MLADDLAAGGADAFLESYVCWREASETVRTAYDRWRRGRPRDRGPAFAAYRAALDREERAALRFGERAGLVGRSAPASHRPHPAS
jgi:hypothetical protein